MGVGQRWGEGIAGELSVGCGCGGRQVPRYVRVCGGCAIFVFCRLPGNERLIGSTFRVLLR